MTDPTPDQLREFAMEIVGGPYPNDVLFAYRNVFRPEGDQEDWESNSAKDRFAAYDLLDREDVQEMIRGYEERCNQFADFDEKRLMGEYERTARKAEVKGDLKARIQALTKIGEMKGYFTQRMEVTHKQQSLEELEQQFRAYLQQDPGLWKYLPETVEQVQDAEYVERESDE